MAKKKKKNKAGKIWIFSILIMVFGGALALGLFYQWIYANNLSLDYQAEFFYVNNGDDYEAVKTRLASEKVIKNLNSFDWVAQEKNYPNNIKPGRYKLEAPLNNNEIVNLLRSGKQIPLDIIVKSFRRKEKLAGYLGKQLEPDSSAFQAMFSSKEFLRKYGFKPSTFPALILPNTYEFYWNTSPEGFIARMATEYKSFWTEERKTKAKMIGLSQSEVSTLASIVQSETAKNDEKPKVAGVYLNRLRKGMKLQADPTLLFALDDFTIKRVLNVHKKVNSPYNTYKFKGLPPGPILIPELSSIDAVLNLETHNYFYFCAKEDFSGYHNFATSYRQHLVNAKRYQQALNKRRIFK